MLVNRDEAIFRMYLLKKGLGWIFHFNNKRATEIKAAAKNSVGFAMFNLSMRVGILLRTIREVLL